jgi:hypothetical protein
MKHPKRLLSLILLLLANFCELLFFRHVIVGESAFEFWPLFWHILGVLLLKAGFYLRAHDREIQPLQLQSLHVAHHPQPVAVIPGQNSESPEEPQEIREDIWTTLSIPVGFFIPFLGIPGLTLLVYFSPMDRIEQSKAVEEYRKYIQYQITHRRTYAKIHHDNTVLEKLNIEPVMDLLSGRDKNLVWGSIEVLSRMSDDKAVSLIRKTMANQDMDVKFYSSWGLDRIEDRYFALKKEAETNLAAEFSRENIIALVAVMDDYLSSRLVEGPIIAVNAKETLKTIDQALREFPDDSELIAYQALFFHYAGNERHSLETYRGLQQAQRLPAAFVLPFAESLYNARRFAETATLLKPFVIREEHQEYLDLMGVEAPLSDFREFWESEGESPA